MVALRRIASEALPLFFTVYFGFLSPHCSAQYRIRRPSYCKSYKYVAIDGASQWRLLFRRLRSPRMAQSKSSKEPIRRVLHLRP